MEVHAHTHTERKKFTHYLWEFLMLFLAVTLGFFVENQREHFVDHERARKYAENLYIELKKDTAAINHKTIWTHRVINELDTFCLLSLGDPKNRTTGMLYYYARSIAYLDFFSSNCSTMEELKNSGNLKIMDQKITSGLSNYSRAIRDIENEYSLTRVEYEKMNDLKLKIFDGYTLATLFSSQRKLQRDSCFALNPPLINDDPKLIRELAGWVKIESLYYDELNRTFLVGMNELASKIIETIKNKYHLE